MRRNTVRVLALDRDTLIDQLDDTNAVAYLFAYLSNAAMAARSVVVESHYVDRHYLDDYASYYSRSFNAPPPYCARLHFFTLERDAVQRVLRTAYKDPAAFDRARRRLDAAYCGFVVKRPLRGAAMGRTVLKTYPVDARRQYTTLRPYVVHMAGIRLVLRGLAYQQQDGGTAVCASTALWSALQRVAHVAGHRTPTPSAITAAAGSPFPANHGLGDMQSATALATLGYAAEYFHPDDPTLFRTKVLTCLRSQLPVVLTLKLGEEFGSPQHAVAVTGYSEPSEVVEVAVTTEASFRTRFGSAKTIYVHDDNLGSHAHYEFFVEDDNPGMLKLRRGRSGKAPPSWMTPKNWEENWYVESAIVPKPTKLRVEVDGIIENLIWLKEQLELAFPGFDLHYETRFDSGVEYKKALIAQSLDRRALKRFMTAASLPRYVGVISVFNDDTRLCDVLIDVSEHDRRHGAPAVLGVIASAVPGLSPAHRNLDAMCREFDWLLVTAPASPTPTQKRAPAPRPAKKRGAPR